MEETDLIASARQGDLDSFNQLVLRYQNMVYRQAWILLGNSDEAADAAQEAFILAFCKLRTFRGGSFRAWLLRIVNNYCYDELRRWKRRPEEPLTPVDPMGEDVESPAWMRDPSPSPEDLSERADLRRYLQSCLETLSVEHQAVLLLVDVHGLDYHEASQSLGIPVGTVKSRLARARLQFRTRLLVDRERESAAFIPMAAWG